MARAQSALRTFMTSVAFGKHPQLWVQVHPVEEPCPGWTDHFTGKRMCCGSATWIYLALSVYLSLCIFSFVKTGDLLKRDPIQIVPEDQKIKYFFFKVIS